MEAIKQNIQLFTKEQLEYLKALLNLETTIFQNEDINKQLLLLNSETAIFKNRYMNKYLFNYGFFYACLRYNLFEGLTKVEGINLDNLFFRMGIPQHNVLDIMAYSNSQITAISLLQCQLGIKEDEIPTSGTQIDLYTSNGYNEKIQKELTKKYEQDGETQEQIAFWLNENKEKREITKIISKTILDYWQIFDLQSEVYLDEEWLQKDFAWGRVYTKDLYDKKF